MKIRTITDVKDAKFEYGVIDVYEVELERSGPVEHKKVTALGGEAAYKCVKKVIELALAGDLDATVTGPLHKDALNAADIHYPGHTEIYADMTGTQDFSMMLADEDFRVVHVSTHVSLGEAVRRVKKERVLAVIKLAHDACRQLGIDKPRVGVSGLNPHASDGGLFGDEEEKEIAPAVEEAKKLGIDADGPIPPDTAFSKTRGGWYDICVAMYHDQGHIPMKVAGFVWNEEKQAYDRISGINVTLGLPIIRASVDHGTAYGKAGEGRATAESLVQAISYAVRMAKGRERLKG